MWRKCYKLLYKLLTLKKQLMRLTNMLCSESEGRKMYYFTWFLQFTTLLLCNMGFILLGARALKVQTI